MPTAAIKCPGYKSRVRTAPALTQTVAARKFGQIMKIKGGRFWVCFFFCRNLLFEVRGTHPIGFFVLSFWNQVEFWVLSLLGFHQILAKFVWFGWFYLVIVEVYEGIHHLFSSLHKKIIIFSLFYVNGNLDLVWFLKERESSIRARGMLIVLLFLDKN